MKALGILIALGCIFVGWWTASLSNPSQRIPGLVLAGFGVPIFLVALLFREAILKWALLVTALALIVAYSLPMSFWRLAGLAEGPGGGG